mmetsp:Transcript_734/g.907  ORF Transcript_734/g.907 Transcript_734/m.907 type:complete len:248 (-) Transcript_734:523-1266(-)
MVFPFLLSSNIIFVVGTMKGERLAYLPSFGFVLMIGALFNTLNRGFNGVKVLGVHFLLHIIIGMILTFYVIKTRERNLAWSSNLSLWEAAYQINPHSGHVQYQYGYELALKSRFEEAVKVLKMAIKTQPEDTMARFVLGLSLLNLDKCEETDKLLNEGLWLLKATTETELKQGDLSKEKRNKIARDTSNFIGVMGMCQKDIAKKGTLLYEAVKTDPTNEYMVTVATNLAKQIEQGQQMIRKVSVDDP